MNNMIHLINFIIENLMLYLLNINLVYLRVEMNICNFNFSNLFITEIFHEVEERDFFNNLRQLDNDKDKIDMLFSKEPA